MRIQRCLLCTYGLLLQFYPPSFRNRFATEMLEVATTAKLGEWPLIFGDTGIAIVRCWIEGSRSTAVLTESNAYMSLGGSSVRSFGLGLVLSMGIIFGLAYLGYRWPPACPKTRPLLTYVVAPPQAPAHLDKAGQHVRDRSREQLSNPLRDRSSR